MFSVNADHVEGICNLIKEHAPAYGPQGEVDELAFVMRWAGGWSWRGDVRFAGARPEQPYVPAEHYSPVLSQGVNPRVTKGVLAAGNKNIVEVGILNWKAERMCEYFTQGLLDYNCSPGYQWTAAMLAMFGSYNPDIINPDNVARLHVLTQAQRIYPYPLGILQSPKQ